MAYDANFSESATFNATFAGNAIDAVSNEVIDIRTAYDGTVYPSAGEAVRSQIEEAMESGGSSVPTNVRQAILSLFESAAYAETGLTDEIAVVQSWASEVTEISLSASTLTLNGDTPQTLVATTIPSGSAVVWTTSDSTIATVVGGVVTGVTNGTCRITASAGGKSATCAVTVTGFAELVSISAVYTQSGTVYETDTLDDLRSDLVVTAHYDDRTTETVTTYTLSGTLAVGTSTITVSYGGKTTTFNVTVTHNETPYQNLIDFGSTVSTTDATKITYTVNQDGSISFSTNNAPAYANFVFGRDTQLLPTALENGKKYRIHITFTIVSGSGAAILPSIRKMNGSSALNAADLGVTWLNTSGEIIGEWTQDNSTMAYLYIFVTENTSNNTFSGILSDMWIKEVVD